MRKVIYKVAGTDGKIFETSSYAVAAQNGNKIVKTFYETIADPDAEKANKEVRERLARHRGK